MGASRNTSRSSWALPVLAGLSIALLGCPPKYPNCKADDQCSEQGEVCVDGTCQQCREATDCKDSQQCVGGRCEAKSECAKDTDCPDPKVCRSGQCQAECAEASDCGSNMKCSLGQCIGHRLCKVDNDCGANQKCANEVCELSRTAPRDDLAARSMIDACKLPAIRFGFNAAELSSQSREQLAAVADCIREHSGVVTIEGHCDERGTTEFNLALGDRRARAVYKYLSTLGVPRSRLRPISKGEEEPLDDGRNEAAWTANRRTEFEE